MIYLMRCERRGWSEGGILLDGTCLEEGVLRKAKCGEVKYTAKILQVGENGPKKICRGGETGRGRTALG
jgi:hypothetical protein